MKKTARSGFGLIALSIVFLLLYGYFNTVGTRQQPTPSLTEESGNSDLVTLGNLGGFHLLESITCSDEQTYYRVAIQTQLNRSTLIDRSIGVPLTKITQAESSEPIWWAGSYRDTKSWGGYRLQISLSDTDTMNRAQEETTSVFQGDKTMKINQPPITQIQLWETSDGSASQVVVGLNNKVNFQASSNATGTIYIDILK